MEAYNGNFWKIIWFGILWYWNDHVIDLSYVCNAMDLNDIVWNSLELNLEMKVIQGIENEHINMAIPELDQRSMNKPWKNHDQTNGCVRMVQDLSEFLDHSKQKNRQWLLPTQRSMGKAFRNCKWHEVGLNRPSEMGSIQSKILG